MFPKTTVCENENQFVLRKAKGLESVFLIGIRVFFHFYFCLCFSFPSRFFLLLVFIFWKEFKNNKTQGSWVHILLRGWNDLRFLAKSALIYLTIVLELGSYYRSDLLAFDAWETIVFHTCCAWELTIMAKVFETWFCFN